MVLIFEHRRNPEIETPRALEMVEAVEAGSARFASGPMINPSILEHELSADYREIAALTNRLGMRLKGVRRCGSRRRSAPIWTLDITGRDSHA